MIAHQQHWEQNTQSPARAKNGFSSETRHLGTAKRAQNKKGAEQKGRRAKRAQSKKGAEQKGRRTKRAQNKKGAEQKGREITMLRHRYIQGRNFFQ